VGEEREILGSYLGSGQPAIDIGRYIQMYTQGTLPVDRLMGETFTLERINEGFDRLASGQGLRDAIMFD